MRSKVIIFVVVSVVTGLLSLLSPFPSSVNANENADVATLKSNSVVDKDLIGSNMNPANQDRQELIKRPAIQIFPTGPLYEYFEEIPPQLGHYRFRLLVKSDRSFVVLDVLEPELDKKEKERVIELLRETISIRTPAKKNGKPTDFYYNLTLRTNPKPKRIEERTILEAGNGEDIPQPELLYRVEPKYPERAKKQQITDCIVKLRVKILQDGTVGHVSVEDVSNKGWDFETEVIKAVQQWKFEPSTFNGKPVAVSVAFSVEFNLLY